MAGKVITPRQLAQQWLRLPNKFEVNVFNFETLVGNAAKKIFRDSFYLRRFNSAGTFSWQSRLITCFVRLIIWGPLYIEAKMGLFISVVPMDWLCFKSGPFMNLRSKAS